MRSKLQNVLSNDILLSKLFANSLEGITLIDRQYNVIYRTQSAERIGGYSNTIRMQQPLVSMLAPEDRPKVEALLGEISRENGNSKKMELQIFHALGHRLWIECTFTNLLQDQDIEAIVLHFKDISVQKRAQHNAELVLNRLRLLESVVTHSKDAVMITEAEPKGESGSRIMYVNDAFSSMTGYQAEEVIGRSPRFLHGPKTDRLQLAKMKESMLMFESCEATLVNYKKNGDEFWVNLTLSPVADENGRFTHWIAIERDVTEKKELEDLLHTATTLAGIGGWDFDLVKDKLYWSTVARQIFEVTDTFQPTPNWLTQFFRNKKDTGLVRMHLAKAIEANEPFDFEIEVLTAAKHSKWVRVIGMPEWDVGKCVRIRGSFQDIDVRKRAELLASEALGEKNEILESIGDGFFAVDNRWRVTYWNSRAQAVLGKQRREVMGKNLWEVFPEAVHSESYERYHWALANKKEVRFETYHEGIHRWFAVGAYPSKAGISVYFKDITERKMTDKRIVESERRYSELFQLSPLPKWVFDLQTLRFLDVNQAALTHYGYTRKEFLNMSILDIRPKEEIPRLEQVLHERRRKKSFIYQGLFTHRKKNGELIRVEIRSNLIEYNGRPAKIIIADDVTEREN